MDRFIFESSAAVVVEQNLTNANFFHVGPSRNVWFVRDIIVYWSPHDSTTNERNSTCSTTGGVGKKIKIIVRLHVRVYVGNCSSFFLFFFFCYRTTDIALYTPIYRNGGVIRNLLWRGKMYIFTSKTSCNP